MHDCKYHEDVDICGNCGKGLPKIFVDLKVITDRGVIKKQYCCSECMAHHCVDNFSFEKASTKIRISTRRK